MRLTLGALLTLGAQASLPAMSAASARTITHTLVRDYLYPRQCFLLETGIIIIRRKFIQLTLRRSRNREPTGVPARATRVGC